MIRLLYLLLALMTVDALTAQSGDGTFEVVKYSQAQNKVDLGVGLWAWPLPMDYDLDGDMDLLVSCTDVPFNGVYFFENRSGDAIPIFEPPVKISEGMKDLQISYTENGERIMGRSVEYRDFRDTFFGDPVDIYAEAESLYEKHSKIRFRQWKYVDYEGDGDLDLIVGIDDWSEYGWDDAYNEAGEWTNGPLHGYVYLILKDRDMWTFSGRIQAGGEDIDVYGAPSPNMADFDGDGDLDLICGEFIDGFTWFENTGTRTDPIYAAGRQLKGDADFIKMDLQMIVPVALDWDRDGDIDLVVGDEDGRVALVRNSGKVRNQMPVFEDPHYFSQRGGNVKFGALITPYAVDWDDDGDEDLICGNTAGYIGFIENLQDGQTPDYAPPVLLKADGQVIRFQAGENGSIQGPCEAKWGYTTLSVADWDGDGLKDIIVNSIWGKIEWLRNVGTEGYPKLSSPQPIMVHWNGPALKPSWNWWDPNSHELATQWRTTPYAIDWNQDQVMDLVMLDHEGYLSWFEGVQSDGRRYVEGGKRIFYADNASAFDNKNRVKDSIPGLLRLNLSDAGSSGRRKFCFVDWDQDGDQDLIINSLNADLFENISEEEGKVTFSFRGSLSDMKLAGHTTSPTTTYQDGKVTLLLGAEDGHIYRYVR